VGDDLTEEALKKRAIVLAQKFVAQGATLIDVGGESTRPHAAAVSIEQELARVIPVITALREVLAKEVIISIDTYKAQVARQALQVGANMINDIWALRHDAEMAALVAEKEIPVVLMANMRGYQKRAIMSDIVRFLSASIDQALVAGIAMGAQSSSIQVSASARPPKKFLRYSIVLLNCVC